MLLSHRKKFIFTKTVKTAGTSVESFYERFCMPEGEWTSCHAREECITDAGIIGYRGKEIRKSGFYNHMSAEEIRAKVGDQVWDEYYKFTVVRNPFSKLLSGYYYFHKPRIMKKRTVGYICRHPKLIFRMLSGHGDILDFRQWVRREILIDDRDKYLINDKPCLDYFIRYEHLEADINELNSILKIDTGDIALPRLKGNSSKRFKISDYYDTETEEIVRNYYKWEFERFGYEMP